MLPANADAAQTRGDSAGTGRRKQVLWEDIWTTVVSALQAHSG